MRTTGYRPIQNIEASGINVEAMVPFLEVKSAEKFYYSQAETETKNQDIEFYCQPCVEEVEDIKVSQREATINTIIQELDNTAIMETKEGKTKIDTINLWSSLPRIGELEFVDVKTVFQYVSVVKSEELCQAASN